MIGRPIAARFAAGTAGIIVFILIWWAAIVFLVPPGSPIARFAPADGLRTLAGLVDDPRILDHILASLRRIAVGLAAGALVGIPIGLAVGSVRLAASATGPIFGFLRMISPLSWTPIAIMLFGVGDAPVIFLVAMGATWPIVMNTSAGVAGLDPTWPRVARSLGATPVETLRLVVWPGVRTDVMTGLRVATGLAWVILVPAEMLGVDSGLGYFILDARDRFAYDELTAAVLIIGSIGLGLDLLARLAFGPRRRRFSARPHAAARRSARLRPTLQPTRGSDR